MQFISYILGLTILFTLVSFNSFGSEEHNQLFRKPWTMKVSIDVQDFKKSFEKISQMDLDIAGVDIKNKKIDLLIGELDYQALLDNGFEVSIDDTKGVTRGPDEEYKNPNEIEDILNEYAQKYSHLVKMVSIGKSLEGRDIWALKISDNPNLDELEEPAVLFNSMHHAREVMTPEISLDIIEQLLTEYSKDSKITNWVNNTEIWVIPMFNVDGNNKMWTHDSWWRKNVRGGYGVDLNRNYPSGWGSCNGSSGSQSSQTYRGPSPGSEPETQAMMNFISKVRPVFDISYHSYSELVIYPFGCKGQKTQTREVVEKIGNEIAARIDYEPGTAWELLYNADGGDIDWMYEAYQVIPYVIEVSSRREGFHPRYSKWRDKTVERNRDGWQYLLKRVQESGYRGVINNLSDFQVEVYKVENGSESLFQNYMGHKTGVFHLVLNPGNYKLKIKSNQKLIGTKEITIGKVLITEELNF